MKSTHRRPILQNISICDTKNTLPPTIRIVQGEPTWKDAYDNWLAGKNPTDNPEWKRGVYLHFEPIEEEIEEDKLPMNPALITKVRVGYLMLVLLLFVLYGFYRFLW